MKNLIFSLFYIEILFLCRNTHVEIQSHEILFKEKFKTRNKMGRPKTT